jgi:beta-catenin-like protein 1
VCTIRFLESEADLDAEIKNFLILSTSPEHYPLLVRFGVIPSILGLLTHENSDIAHAVVELLKEWTDEDVLEESEEEPVVQFTNQLIQHNLVELLVENLCRLDESLPADRQAVESTLGLIENLLALRPDEMDARLVQKTKLLPWIIKRVQVTTMDSNRLNAVEMLAILLQRSKGSCPTLRYACVRKRASTETYL